MAPSVSVLIVIAKTSDDGSERLDAGSEKGATTVVLEPYHRGLRFREVAVDNDVAYQPTGAGLRPSVEETGAGDLSSAAGQEMVAEQLVTAANRQQNESVRDRSALDRRL